MSDSRLRESIAAMVQLVTGAEECAMLATRAEDQERASGPEAWSISALVAHNSEFRSQQVTRLGAVIDRSTPPNFSEIDHTSLEVYARFSALTADQVLAGCRSTTTELVQLLWQLTDEDLTDPARNPWLRGRPLWLQVVARGFWHPSGHLGEYWLSRGLPEKAVRLHAAGVALAEAVQLPGAALGMARYSLACAKSRTGHCEEALAEIVQAINGNPDLAQNAARDPDLEPVRALPGWPCSAN
ncbi:MAG: TPR end-of-group domain-containing protein [Candidatus Dormibacteria bacterium]